MERPLDFDPLPRLVDTARRQHENKIVLSADTFKHIRRKVREVIENSSSQNSRIHPLGFLRISAEAEFPEMADAVVNVWSGGLGHAREDAHNHCYDFFSICVAGSLSHTLYKASARLNDETYSHFRYFSRPDSCSASEELGGKKLQVSAEQVVRSGEGYFMKSDVIHSIVSPSEVTITLQCQFRDRSLATADVFRSISAQSLGDGTTLSIDTVKKMALEVLLCR